MLRTLLTVSIILLVVYGIDGAGRFSLRLSANDIENMFFCVGVSPTEIVVRVNQTFSIKCSLPSLADGVYDFYDGDEVIPREFIKVS